MIAFQRWCGDKSVRIYAICSGHTHDDERVTQKEAVSLSRQGYEVTVCACRKGGYFTPEVKFIDVDTLLPFDGTIAQGVKHEATRFMRFLRLRNLFTLVKRDRPELVIAHEFETGLLAWWIRIRLNIPYVFDAHECYEETMHLVFPRFVRPLARCLLVQWLRMIVRHAAGITAASPAALAYTYAKHIGLPAFVLHNSPILDFFPYVEAEGDPLVIVHDGNLTFERGALEILDALSLVKRQRTFTFLVLGAVPPEVKAPFMVKLTALGLQDHVDLRGHLPWTEFGKIEATGQIGLICSQPVPNHMLSLSNKLYNYMACGLAVLGMMGSETEKITLAHGCGLAVDTSKPEEIAKGIIWLIDHPEERREMARNGRKAIEQELGWHRMEKVMAEMYLGLKKELLIG